MTPCWFSDDDLAIVGSGCGAGLFRATAAESGSQPSTSRLPTMSATQAPLLPRGTCGVSRVHSSG